MQRPSTPPAPEGGDEAHYDNDPVDTPFANEKRKYDDLFAELFGGDSATKVSKKVRFDLSNLDPKTHPQNLISILKNSTSLTHHDLRPAASSAHPKKVTFAPDTHPETHVYRESGLFHRLPDGGSDGSPEHYHYEPGAHAARDGYEWLDTSTPAPFLNLSLPSQRRFPARFDAALSDFHTRPNLPGASVWDVCEDAVWAKVPLCPRCLRVFHSYEGLSRHGRDTYEGLEISFVDDYVTHTDGAGVGGVDVRFEPVFGRGKWILLGLE